MTSLMKMKDSLGESIKEQFSWRKASPTLKVDWLTLQGLEYLSTKKIPIDDLILMKVGL